MHVINTPNLVGDLGLHELRLIVFMPMEMNVHIHQDFNECVMRSFWP